MALQETFDIIKKKFVMDDIFISGWKDYVRDLLAVARDYFLQWFVKGKPLSS